jgi:hypothetical protein
MTHNSAQAAMISQIRIISAVALAALGFLAFGALRKRAGTPDSRGDVERQLTTWEGEGGNPAGGPTAPRP